MKHLSLVILSLLLGCDKALPPLPLEVATLLPTPKIVPDFSLRQYSKQKKEVIFSQEDLKNKWSLLFFGYTHCPDVCPTELYMLSRVIKKIQEKPDSVQALPQVIFVSVDAQRDTAQSLHDYVGFFHPLFIGITGSQNVVDLLAEFMWVRYQRVYSINGKPLQINKGEQPPEILKDSYLIDHSASIILVNPEGEMHAIFPMPHKPDSIIKDLSAIQKSWNGSGE